MSESLYGPATGRRVTTKDLAAAKERGEKWPMITAYDALTAGLFDAAGIPVMLVGDSAAMVVYGHDSTIPVTVDELKFLCAARDAFLLPSSLVSQLARHGSTILPQKRGSARLPRNDL